MTNTVLFEPSLQTTLGHVLIVLTDGTVTTTVDDIKAKGKIINEVPDTSSSEAVAAAVVEAEDVEHPQRPLPWSWMP